MNLQAQTKKCPDGFRFDEKLGVCVPKGQTRYAPFYGYGSRNGNDTQNTNGTNGANGNGANGNGNGGNGNGGNGNGGNGGNGGGNGS